MHQVKSYDQNNLRSLRKAISFVFWACQEPQSGYPEEALPIGLQSSSLYFWNQQNQENEGRLQANSKSNFYFLAPQKMHNSKDFDIVITPKPSKATATQLKSNPKQLGCGFDTIIGLHHPPPTPSTTTHRNSNFSLRAIQGNINQCHLIQSS